MLNAGLVYGRTGGLGSYNPMAAVSSYGTAEGVLSLNFFLRVLRALGRHLAPITVPSPLVRYCHILVVFCQALSFCCRVLQLALRGTYILGKFTFVISSSRGSLSEVKNYL